MRGKEKVDRSGYLFSNRDLTALLIPLVIEQLLSVLVGMADSIMVASVGEAAVSGVSLVDNIMVLLINVFAALATGGAVVAGQYLGQKQRELLSRMESLLEEGDRLGMKREDWEKKLSSFYERKETGA